MASKRKRKYSCNDASKCKKQRITGGDTPVRRDLLERSYARVTTLREHILSNLPGSSRLRRKKIASLGHNEGAAEIESQLAHLLDTSLVCAHQPEVHHQETRWEQWLSFSQKGDESHVTLANGLSGSIYSQSEVVDFVIWLLFSRESKVGKRPKHLLCDGFRRGTGSGGQAGVVIPGLFSLYPNSNVKAIKEAPWPQLLVLLGRSGEKMMIDLLVDCAIYVTVQAGIHNYEQRSGIPLSEIDLPQSSTSVGNVESAQCRKPAEITLVRSRLFYAKPSLTARGLVQAGFKHIHVLNRCPRTLNFSKLHETASGSKFDVEQRRNSIKVMMYMFPRQFGLHNVFNSQVDTSQTAQRFQDYTLREEEISIAFPSKSDTPNHQLPKLPKRLRGDAQHLVERLQTNHGRCSFIELLKHYCPCIFDPHNRSCRQGPHRGCASSDKKKHPQANPATAESRIAPKKQFRKTQPGTQVSPLPQYKNLVEIATPPSQVSAFCQAALLKIIPSQFWGDGDTQIHNKLKIRQKIEHFVKLRRFESMSLHEISQDLKITDISWLRPPGLGTHKSSQTDTAKRQEIFLEFLYYVFDSLLIPLIRSNFYVTESSSHRYQVFYFRHDVWKYIAEPSMAKLKAGMFEEIKLDDALRILQSRRLGFSQIRLLPKGDRLRPITNLRRRALARGGAKVLGPSINSILGPVHSLLKFEKTLNPSKLGSTMFSVSDIYTRLKEFKRELGCNHGKLYFAKVDVQAAFDTIPQAAVVNLIGSLPNQSKYTITKHVEIKPGERAELQGNKAVTKAIRRWHAITLPESDVSCFSERIEADLGKKKKNTVFVNSAIQKTHSAQELLSLLKQHVAQNLVKVGKKYYRQKVGIPQGSVLSSFLCNYFYADLESKHLSFLTAPDTLLLRLIDDFLLITLDRDKATRFVETMHRGLPEYGVVVNPKKTLVNFDMWSSQGDVLKLDRGLEFPYCGTLINCQTLNITKDHQRDAGVDISASLTVDFGHVPGQNFQRKVLNAFKIQSHLMFFDTAHNSARTVIASLHDAFIETAHKMWAYIRCLGKFQQLSNSIIIRTVSKVIDVAFLLLTSKSRTMRYPQYSCGVRKTQVALTACAAFTEVLSRKPTKFDRVIQWLRTETERLSSEKK